MKFKCAAMVIVMISPLVSASEFDSVKAKLEAAMQADVRTEQETARDPNRLPIETLEFFGLRETPSVAGGRQRLLLHLLAPNGRPAQVTQEPGELLGVGVRSRAQGAPGEIPEARLAGRSAGIGL